MPKDVNKVYIYNNITGASRFSVNWNKGRLLWQKITK